MNLENSLFTSCEEFEKKRSFVSSFAYEVQLDKLQSWVQEYRKIPGSSKQHIVAANLKIKELMEYLNTYSSSGAEFVRIYHTLDMSIGEPDKQSFMLMLPLKSTLDNPKTQSPALKPGNKIEVFVECCHCPPQCTNDKLINP